MFPFLCCASPENTRKPKAFPYFQGVKNENIGQKWVELGEAVYLKNLDLFHTYKNRSL